MHRNCCTLYVVLYEFCGSCTLTICVIMKLGLTILYQWNLVRKHFSVFHKWWRTDGSQGNSTIGYYNNRCWCDFEIDSQSDIPTSCWITSSTFIWGICRSIFLLHVHMHKWNQWSSVPSSVECNQFVSVCQSSTSSANQAILSPLK